MAFSVQHIEALSREIAVRYKPERIVLFGSHATGKAAEHSDVDLLVVMNFSGPPARKAAEILDGIHSVLPIDIIVRTPETLENRLAQNDFFLQDILSTGKVLYAAPKS